MKKSESFFLFSLYTANRCVVKEIQQAGDKPTGEWRKKMNTDELNIVLEKHKLWLERKVGGVQADLRSADLRSADLRSADLRSADLRSADLRYTDLRTAKLNSADLRTAKLSYAKLSYTDLSSADLSYADLSYAKLSYAKLSYADLSSADLSSADLRSADLRSADLRSADLSYAKLTSADLHEVRNLIWAECSFSGHGECGRRLISVRISGDDVYFCGCFKGSASELYEYIQNGDKSRIPTRMSAFRFVWCQMAAAN